MTYFSSNTGKENNQQPHSRLAALGIERLSLLGKFSAQLMQAYLTGHFDEASVSEQALAKLMKARLLWRPDEQQALCLRPGVNELIASITEDERKRQINADIAGQLDQIRTRVAQYQDAQYRSDYSASEHHFQLLSEKVHDMTGQFADAITSLWNRLNSDFGFVSSLSDKIRENELAQKQLRRLLDGFELIDFTEMIELAQHNGALRKLLVSQLQMTISEHAGSLLEVQKRLVELMARFRQQQELSLLITNMSAFLKQHPNFSPGDYANRSQVPDIINQAKGFYASASVALDRASEQQTLSQLVQGIPRKAHTNENEQPSGEHFVDGTDEMVAAREQQLKTDVEDFFLAIFEQNTPQVNAVSALDYLQEKALTWDAEIWLFQVIAEFDVLPHSTQQHFIFTKKTQAINPFNQVEIIYDIELCLNHLGSFQQVG